MKNKDFVEHIILSLNKKDMKAKKMFEPKRMERREFKKSIYDILGADRGRT